MAKCPYLERRHLWKRLCTAITPAKHLIRKDVKRICSVEEKWKRCPSYTTKIKLMRCSMRHQLPDESIFHAIDSHYCLVCKRWYSDRELIP